MASSVLSFSGYLSAGARIAATLRSQHATNAVALARALAGSQVTVVMGNQACDADSIVTSLAYGYGLVRRHVVGVHAAHAVRLLADKRAVCHVAGLVVPCDGAA